MRKGVLFFVSLLFSFSSIFADFQVETFLSEEEQKQIIEKMDNIHSNSLYYKEINEHHIGKGKYKRDDDGKHFIDESLIKISNELQKNNSEQKRFILQYALQLFKQDLYNWMLFEYGLGDYGYEVIEDIDENLHYFSSEDKNYIGLLDLKFSSYKMDIIHWYSIKDLYYENVIKVGEKAINELNKIGDSYDNYHHYLGEYSKYIAESYKMLGDTNNYEKYSKLYEKYKNIKLNRLDNVKSSMMKYYYKQYYPEYY